MVSNINVNGMNIEVDGDSIRINGSGKASKETVIDKSGVIKGDVGGNIRITGNNVKLIIEGDVEGNIIGNAEITVKGNIEGNIVGGTVRR